MNISIFKAVILHFIFSIIQSSLGDRSELVVKVKGKVVPVLY
jgi:hypothetical protein